jgi:hypothetical protein
MDPLQLTPYFVNKHYLRTVPCRSPSFSPLSVISRFTPTERQRREPVRTSDYSVHGLRASATANF